MDFCYKILLKCDTFPKKNPNQPVCAFQKGNLDLIFIKANGCLDACQRKVLKRSAFPEMCWNFFLVKTVQFCSSQFNLVKVTASSSDV